MPNDAVSRRSNPDSAVSQQPNPDDNVSRRSMLQAALIALGGITLGSMQPSEAYARSLTRYYKIVYKLNGGTN